MDRQVWTILAAAATTLARSLALALVAAPWATARADGGRAGDSATLEAPAPTARPLASHLIYSCEIDGSLIVSDLPCDRHARARPLQFHSPSQVGQPRQAGQPPHAGEPPQVEPSPAPARPHSTPGAQPSATPATQAATTAAACDALRSRLAALDDRMRSGYTAREAGRLWERRRTLKQQLRAARC